MIVPDHYCGTLQIGMQVSLGANSSIQVSPCALEPFTFAVDQKVFDHPDLVAIRQSNQNNQRLEGYCAGCKRREDLGIQGKVRSSSNERYIKDSLLYNQLGPKIITFKLDYTCNLACVTCGPALSTKWRGIEHTKGLPVQANVDLIRSTIRNINLEQLETVHIFGGEPLLTRTHEVILEELAAYSKNITVWYDTNATVLPTQHTLELWERFHLVRLKFSLDGTGKSFEYLRWPAVWSEAEDNILQMKEILPVNHMLSLRPAVGILNFHVIKDLRAWQQQYLLTNRLGDPTEFEYNPVYGLFSPGNMTQAMVDELRNLYDLGDPILDLLPSSTNNPLAIIDIQQRLAQMDQQRNLTWQQALPHLIPYLADSR